MHTPTHNIFDPDYWNPNNEGSSTILGGIEDSGTDTDMFSQWGFDPSQAPAPTTQAELEQYLRDIGIQDEAIIAALIANFNLYDPYKEDMARTQFGFDVDALAQTQRGTILSGLTQMETQKFAGKGLKSGKTTSDYRSTVSGAGRDYEEDLKEKQFGLAKDIYESRKEYSLGEEAAKLKELEILTPEQLEIVLTALQRGEEWGIDTTGGGTGDGTTGSGTGGGDTSFGYPSHSEYVESQELREDFQLNTPLSALYSAATPANISLSMADPHASVPRRSYEYGPVPTYFEHSSFKPKWLGMENETLSFEATPHGDWNLVGPEGQAGAVMGGSSYDPWHQGYYGYPRPHQITAVWPGQSGVGTIDNWQITKTPKET